MTAVEKGHTDVVRLLVEHSSSKNIDLNARTEFEETGIMYACEVGHQDVVQFLATFYQNLTNNVKI